MTWKDKLLRRLFPMRPCTTERPQGYKEGWKYTFIADLSPRERWTLLLTGSIRFDIRTGTTHTGEQMTNMTFNVLPPKWLEKR